MARGVKVVQRILCMDCDRPIEPLTGIIIQGNVYGVDADTSSRGGVIGNAFPTDSFTIDDVDEVALHLSCLVGILDRNGIYYGGDGCDDDC